MGRPAVNPRPLEMWVVTDNPKDFPGKFVARKVLAHHGILEYQTETIVEDKLELVRQQLKARQLVSIPRHPNDDSVIVETWL